MTHLVISEKWKTRTISIQKLENQKIVNELVTHLYIKYKQAGVDTQGVEIEQWPLPERRIEIENSLQ